LKEMTPSTGRLILSWIVGIVLFGILHYFFEKAASSLDFKTSFYFVGFEYDQYVEEDRSTPLGWFLIVVEIIVASRIGMAIYHGNFKNGIGEHTNLFLTTLIICFAAYALIDTVIWEFFERELRRNVPPLVYNIMDIMVMAGIGYAGFVTYQHLKHKKQYKSDTKNVFSKVFSEDGDHFLEKKEDIFFLGYDNHKDLRVWKFVLPNSISEQELTKKFFEKTGRGIGRFDFYKWLEKEGVSLQEHNWY